MTFPWKQKYKSEPKRIHFQKLSFFSGGNQ